MSGGCVVPEGEEEIKLAVEVLAPATAAGWNRTACLGKLMPENIKGAAGVCWLLHPEGRRRLQGFRILPVSHLLMLKAWDGQLLGDGCVALSSGFHGVLHVAGNFADQNTPSPLYT